MLITRDDNGHYDFRHLTPFQVQLIADALEVLSPYSQFAEDEAEAMVNKIRRELEE